MLNSAGDDSILGGEGNDTYSYALGQGNDYISEDGGNDLLIFADQSISDVRFTQAWESLSDGDNARDLIVNNSDGTTVTVSDFFDGSTSNELETIEFSDGQTLTKLQAISKSIADQHTSGDDVVFASEFADNMINSAGNDTLIAGEGDALAFADLAASLNRGAVGGTGIGDGLAVAMRKFDRNGFNGTRQTVDVSGDGRETPPREIVVTMPTARSMALSRGVTINGLAILNEDENLDTWYRNHVIVGPQSFVIAVADYDDFAEAMVRKLIREIENNPRIGLLAPNDAISARAPIP